MAEHVPTPQAPALRMRRYGPGLKLVFAQLQQEWWCRHGQRLADGGTLLTPAERSVREEEARRREEQRGEERERLLSIVAARPVAMEATGVFSKALPRVADLVNSYVGM